MISWIQKYFQKHFRLVFGLILIAMAVPLVVIYNQSSGLHAGRNAAERLFFGRNLGSEEESRVIGADAVRSLQLRGAQPNEGQIQQYALARLAGLALADQLHIPQPTEKEVAAYIANLRVFHDQQGNFDQKLYQQFADSLKGNPQFTIADANRVFRDDARLETLGKLVGGPGYVLPADVRTYLSQADVKWTIAVATQDYNAFKPDIPVTEEALKKYFDENAFRYEVGPRAKLSVVSFKTAEFVPPAPPSEDQVRAFYNANKARFPAPTDPTKKDEKPGTSLDPAKAPATDDFPKVRAQVEEAMVKQAGMQNAMKAANDFTVALYERKLSANSAELAAFLATQKRPAIALAPFSAENPPADIPWLAYYAEPISRLNKDRYFSDPLLTPDGAVVLLWNETLPGYKPMFPEVKDKVTADYKENEKRKRFAEQSKTVRGRLEAAVKAGTPFEKAAAGEKLEVKSYAAFTLASPPQDAPQAALGALDNLNAGQITDTLSPDGKAYYVFAAQKQLPDLSPGNPRYAEVRTGLMNFNASSNESAVLQSLVESELKKSAPPETATR